MADVAEGVRIIVRNRDLALTRPLGSAFLVVGTPSQSTRTDAPQGPITASRCHVH
jgi:hypothetical protein